jgi:hypothetical protein
MFGRYLTVRMDTRMAAKNTSLMSGCSIAPSFQRDRLTFVWKGRQPQHTYGWMKMLTSTSRHAQKRRLCPARTMVLRFVILRPTGAFLIAPITRIMGDMTIYWNHCQMNCLNDCLANPAVLLSINNDMMGEMEGWHHISVQSPPPKVVSWRILALGNP